ncbi:hypothetical protein DDE18_16430 [Nocardioides gansuensis]|uniref:Mini-circle protein n=2 Tax=Nocardioides gansuensis TaxID=2138300 RepID=A0A2T8F7V9_9ACTN|nr:hypothetical protein DDE18_16430 [Nocardioides gansuensis]
MFVPHDQDPRQSATPSRGERAVLVDYLDAYRLTLELKCEGLTPDQLATPAVPPSRISLLGLVRHMARVEHSWFRRVIEGQDLDKLFSEAGGDGGFTVPRADDGSVSAETVTEAFDLWRAEVAHAREVLAGVELDHLVKVDDDEIEVRDLVVHMIEEYARHCGHADLVRECLDGRAGQ